MDRESQEFRTHSQSWPPGMFVGSALVVDRGTRSRQRDGLTLIALAVCGWCFGYAVTDRVCDSIEQKLLAARVSEPERQAVAPQHPHEVQREAAQTPAKAEVTSMAGVPRAAAVLRPLGTPKAIAVTAARAKSAAAPRTTAVPEKVVSDEIPAAAAVAMQTDAATGELVGLEPMVVPLVLPGSTPPPSAASPVTPAPKRTQGARNKRAAASRTIDMGDEPSPVLTPQEMNRALVYAAASKKIFASVDESAPGAQVIVLTPAAAVPEEDAGDGKAIAIEGLHVDGGLPSNVVNRGVQRLLPQYDRCREFCDSATQRMKLSTTIDEAGHGRQVTVEGLSRPGLRRCLEQATAHLVVPAPDTGTARARWTVRFAAR